MAKRQPWPGEAGIAYQMVVAQYEKLDALITVSIEEGCNDHNKFLLDALLPFIIERAKELRGHAQDICSLLDESQRGMRPKWYSVSQGIYDRALDILELAKEIKPALRRNELIYLQSVYKCLKVEINRVKALLDSHPYRAGLEVWEETVQQAVKKLER